MPSLTNIAIDYLYSTWVFELTNIFLHLAFTFQSFTTGKVFSKFYFKSTWQLLEIVPNLFNSGRFLIRPIFKIWTRLDFGSLAYAKVVVFVSFSCYIGKYSSHSQYFFGIQYWFELCLWNFNIGRMTTCLDWISQHVDMTCNFSLSFNGAASSWLFRLRPEPIIFADS